MTLPLFPDQFLRQTKPLPDVPTLHIYRNKASLPGVFGVRSVRNCNQGSAPAKWIHEIRAPLCCRPVGGNHQHFELR